MRALIAITSYMKNLTLLTALLLATFASLPAAAPAQHPNVVFIFADDWGWGDLSSHGHPWLKTPHLDRLAREGTDFHQFNVLNPVCSPSRAAAMTGMFPSRFGIHEHFAAPAQNLARNMPDWLDARAPNYAPPRTLPSFLLLSLLHCTPWTPPPAASSAPRCAPSTPTASPARPPRPRSTRGRCR